MIKHGKLIKTDYKIPQNNEVEGARILHILDLPLVLEAFLIQDEHVLVFPFVLPVDSDDATFCAPF